jgi:hypothetical protein
VKLPERAALTVIVCDDFATWLAESVTVKAIVKLPPDWYVWVTEIPEAVPPSPKLHEQAKGDNPPEIMAVNETDCPASGEDGVNVKLTDREGSVGLTMMVCWDVAVCWGEPLPLTVRVAVKVPVAW